MAARKPAKKTARAKKSAPRAKKTVAKPRAAAEGLRMSSASPSFTVNDLDRSLSWYRDVVGFDVEETWKDGEKVIGVSLRAGDVSFMIGQDDWKKGRDRKKGEGFRIFCTTRKSVDDIAKRIKSKGGQLDHEPQNQPWGMRDFSVTDPDGFKITIAQNLR
jgi:uncharacterized glyoxalase superfamily protein PhnB